MATYSSILAWEIPNRGAWWVIVHGVARFGYDLMTKPPPPSVIKTISSSVLVNDSIVQIIIFI